MARKLRTPSPADTTPCARPSGSSYGRCSHPASRRFTATHARDGRPARPPFFWSARLSSTFDKTRARPVRP
jgi:hypothetical protein